MAHRTDCLPIKNGDFPVRYVSHNQMVVSNVRNFWRKRVILGQRTQPAAGEAFIEDTPNTTKNRFMIGLQLRRNSRFSHHMWPKVHGTLVRFYHIIKPYERNNIN